MHPAMQVMQAILAIQDMQLMLTFMHQVAESPASRVIFG